MSIGVLSGVNQSGKKIEIIFAVYYKSNMDLGMQNLIAEKTGINVSSSSSNDFRVMTFDDFEREGDARWATHEIMGKNKKPILEFLGPGLENISFSILLMNNLGVNPETELAKLRELRDNGVVCDFIVGQNALGKNKWVVSKLSESHKYFNGKGVVIGASVSVSLNEYVKLPKEKKK